MASPAETASARYYEQFARHYDLFFSDLEASMAREGDWLDTILRHTGAVSVLDACCGAGRQAIPLAQRGYRVTAADPCGAMLEEGRRQARELGVELWWRELAFVDLPAAIGETFDAVIALGNGLCHQERSEEIVASLRALRTRCRPGGVCLIGVKDFDAIRGNRVRFHGRSIRDREGERIILFEVWDYADPLLLCTAYTVRGQTGAWSTMCGQTREYMLGEEELRWAAGEAGFSEVTRLDHPCEAVYALR